MQQASAVPVPVTILTGFLGAGKTTLLNRLLAVANERIVVIENEFGPVSIDSELLIQATAELVEMTNGCLCCTIRGDLARHLRQLHARRMAGELLFDRLVIETTGLADPTPIAQTFFSEAELADAYVLDGVVAVVDAIHADEQLSQHAVARKQVGFADRLLISKSDLAEPANVAHLSERLAAMNLQAAQLELADGQIDASTVFDLRGFHLDEGILQSNKAEDAALLFRPVGGKSFGDDIAAIHLQHEGCLDFAQISAFMRELVERCADDLLRYKGVLAVSGNVQRLIFQGVHQMLGFDYGRPWQDGETPVSDMVLIGRSLPEEWIRSSFMACIAQEAL
ncbi:MAG: GTP-binding protein [Burkholderiaceae bacterium]|nr:GTP-binding protein [Burkholderiaceae bacterium]